MPTRATEIRQAAALPNDAPGDCGTCDRRLDRVYADRLWRWALAHPGESPFRRAG